MPRGVAVPEARQQLFAALERVLAAEGSLTSRAVTQEAGVATGLLFTHFRNFDNFLAGYAVDRSFQIASALTSLPEKYGSGSVAGNLSDAVLGLPPGVVVTLTRLLAFRPSVAAEAARVLGAENAGLRAAERAAETYLVAEQQLGRVPAGADPVSLSLAVAGILQHVALTVGPGPAADERIRRAIAAVIPVTGAGLPLPSAGPPR
jgi:AcrR family transcriptional regulator